jgi:hypothetical protein
MNKDLKQLINEILDEMFYKSYGEREWRTSREIYEDTCPHCKHKINEYSEYTDDGGITWRHIDCKKVI